MFSLSSSKPKPKPSGDGKKTPAPEKNTEAPATDDKGGDGGGGDNAPDPSSGPELLSDPLGWLLGNPVFALIAVLIIITAAMWGLRRLWTKMTLRQNMRGRPLAPLGFTVRRSLTLMLKEDKYPVFSKPEKFAERVQSYTWTRHWRLVFLLTVLWVPFAILVGGSLSLYVLAFLALVWWMGVRHVRRVFLGRHRILMQMFEVASGEMRYPRGAELNPWGYVQISKWIDLYTPDETSVMYPPKYRSEDQRNREAFELNFNGTVSDQYTWTYNWESSNNRVVCTPVPFITTRADYPFPDQHPWNIVPLGIGAGGEEALLNIGTFPHVLVAGTTGSGKLYTLSQVIPVPVSSQNPTGWTTFGEIKVGDVVFDEKGKPCRVTGLSEIREDCDIYRVTFDDGTSVEAGGDHLWFTEMLGEQKPCDKPILGTDIDEETIARLSRGLSNIDSQHESTLSELAGMFDVPAVSPWLSAVAERIGPSGETQIILEYPQTGVVEIKAKDTTYFYESAKVWKTLIERSTKKDTFESWDLTFDKCMKYSERSTPEGTLTAQEAGKALGVKTRHVESLLKTRGVENWLVPRGRFASPLNVFSAREAWMALAENAQEQRRLSHKPTFIELLESSVSGELVSDKDVASILGLDVFQTREFLRKIRVACTAKKETPVREETSTRNIRVKSITEKTYLTREFLSVALEYIASQGDGSSTTGGVRTTLDILDTLYVEDGTPNHAVPVAGPLDLPQVELPVEPYEWGGRLTGTSLIPPAFLRASREQREALLYGIIASGLVTQSQLGNKFVSESNELSRQVAELVRSLGYRAVVTSEVGKGPIEDVEIYVVSWHSARDSVSPGEGRHRIVSVERIPTSPARCIMVDSPSRLFLAGESMVPTHNSVTQRTILLHFLQKPDVRVCLIDPKRVELAAYRGHPNVLRVATELDEAVALIEQIEQEMQSRYMRMQEEGKNFFKDMDDPPPALLLMIDETFALLSPENIKSDEGKERDELHARAAVLIGSIARLGRAAGVHMILATQRPDAKVISGETKPLALDTPVLTSDGWSEIGALREGDVLFDDFGQPTTVVKTTEVLEGQECFEIEFGDGSQIVADSEHLWVLVEDDGVRFAMSTFELYDSLAEGGGNLWVPQVSIGSGKGSEPVLSRMEIVSVKRTESVPVRCVAVDGPTELFLVGRACIATHNSNLDARIAQGRMDTIPSQMTLDSDAATRIPAVKGRAVLRTGNDFTEFQAYLLETEHLAKVLEMTAALATGKVDVDFFLQAGGGEQAGGGKKKINLPKIPLPAGLVNKFKNWVEKRKQVVEENEIRAGRTEEARSKRAKRKSRKEDSSDEAVDVSLRHEPSIAEVAAQAAARGTPLESSSLFDGVPGEPHTQGGEPPRFDDDLLDDDDLFEDINFGEELWSSLDLPNEVPPPHVDPATGLPVSAQNGVQDPYINVDEPYFGSDVPGEVGVPDITEFPPDIYADEPEFPVEPETVLPPPSSVPVMVPGLLVAEVLQRARARGVPVSASELLLALRQEARIDEGAVSQASTPSLPSGDSAQLMEAVTRSVEDSYTDIIKTTGTTPPLADAVSSPLSPSGAVPIPPPPPTRQPIVEAGGQPPIFNPAEAGRDNGVEDDMPWISKDIPIPPAKGPSPFGGPTPTPEPPQPTGGEEYRESGGPPPPPPPRQGPRRPTRPQE